MQTRFVILLLTALLFLSSLNFPQDKPAKFDAFMRRCFEFRLFNGTILVAEAGQVVYRKAFGLAHREWEVPHTLDTKFLIGSVSKQFTAVLVLQLVEEGKLKLEDAVSKYIPDFPKDKGDRITLHHLLSHSSGLLSTQDLDNWYSDLWLREYTTMELVRLFYEYELAFEPGSRFLYSNPGYYIAAAIIEKITGKKYAEVLQERILRPLGMKNSGSYDYYTIHPKMASAYEYWNFRYSHSDYWNPTSTVGAGGIYSTVEDLFRWDRALYTQKLLPRKFIDLMLQPHISLRGSDSYGYGWVLGEHNVIGRDKPVRFAMHTGAHPGFNCLLMRFVDEGHFVVLFNNTGHTEIKVIQDGLVNILYGQPAHLKQPLSLVLDGCRSLRELEAAFEEFRSAENTFSIRRDAVNGLGFQLLLRDQKEMGLAVLEFNAEEHPRSSWVYESLAEAYLMTGQEAKAIVNLKKTLELDPANKSAQKKLDELEKIPNRRLPSFRY
jgi:CubicO group peptidase (beta-lactamase class C family)